MLLFVKFFVITDPEQGGEQQGQSGMDRQLWEEGTLALLEQGRASLGTLL